MEAETTPDTGAYARVLAQEARRLQREARGALERGEFMRASALLADAELLAEDVHGLVFDMAPRDIGGDLALAAYDVRDAAQPAPRGRRTRVMLAPRSLRYAIGASLAISLALGEL